MLLFDHKLLCLSCCCIFHTAKLNLFFVKAKLTLELHQNRSAQTPNSFLHPTFTQYLPRAAWLCVWCCFVRMEPCVCAEQSTKEQGVFPVPALPELQQDTGSCKSAPAHRTNQPNSFQSAGTPFHLQPICCSPANLSFSNSLSFRIPHSREAITAPDFGVCSAFRKKCEGNRNFRISLGDGWWFYWVWGN